MASLIIPMNALTFGVSHKRAHCVQACSALFKFMPKLKSNEKAPLHCSFPYMIQQQALFPVTCNDTTESIRGLLLLESLYY